MSRSSILGIVNFLFGNHKIFFVDRPFGFTRSNDEKE